MTTTSETASEVRKELGQDTAHLRDTLKGRAKQEAEASKSKALGLAGPATGALGAAADELRENPDAPEWMATGLQKLARQIEQIAGDLEGRSLDDLGRDASRLARDNPGTFLAASAAAGFAAARLLRAGADHKRHAQGEGSQMSGQAGLQDQSYASGDTPMWPADENAMPTGSGGSGFAPAYDAEGGTIR
jgi:hypothetical protein